MVKTVAQIRAAHLKIHIVMTAVATKTLSNAVPATVAEAIPPVVAEATIHVVEMLQDVAVILHHVVIVQKTVANSLTIFKNYFIQQSEWLYDLIFRRENNGQYKSFGRVRINALPLGS